MMLKAITLIALSSFTLGLSRAPGGCAHLNTKNVPVMNNEDPVKLKTLAEGPHSAITEPFVAVIRDAETYAKLRKQDENLPRLEMDFFRLNVVVAAFLGNRNTGGYRVEITGEPDHKIRVVEIAPPKDAMVPQVITSPFKVVSFAPSGSTAVELAPGDIFQQVRQRYRISNGSFSLSGGFTGKSESFQLTGQLQLTRLGDLVTIAFALVGTGGQRERSLRGTATGTIKDGRIWISRMTHGSLLDPPSGELEVSGKFLEQNKLTIELASKPVNIPESYGGRGTIEAELVAASAN